MRIVNNLNKLIEFRHVKVGDFFMYDDSLFVRVEPVKEKGSFNILNSLCFTDNRVIFIPGDWHVTPVDVTITIDSKEIKQ